MELISGYIREQKRCTKNFLKDKFKFDEDGVEKFIKSLKAFGVLKSVNNSSEQKEMSDLLDEDLEITYVTAGSGECLYVFTYVGIIIYGSRILKVYPKYLLSGKDNPLEEMKLVIKVLEKYRHSKKLIIDMYNGNDGNQRFNMLSVILFLLKDYYEYGIYGNSEQIIEINGDGDILWGKTIDDGLAFIVDNRPYYMELYTQKAVDDEMDYFKRLHKCVLTECSKQLKESELDILFGMDELALSEERLQDFGDKDFILERISKELNLQFNTQKQILLNTIYSYISQDRKLFDENEGISMFGTTAYYKVWEEVCASVFDNKLNTVLGRLELSVPLTAEYKNYENTELINIIEKPVWEGTDTVKEAKDTLIPDIISITRIDGVDCFYIFDAKYYNIQLESGKVLRGIPGVGDVTKQYLYQLAYKEFINAHNIKSVKNCFLMPTEEDRIISKGTAKMPMLAALGLENIQIRLLSAHKMYEYYLGRKKIDIADLEL